jgi:hypothetical protein
MERPNTIAGLIEMHRTLAGQTEAARRDLHRLVEDMEAVEHTIYLFDPDAQLGRAKPLPSKDAAFKGEMQRHVIAALKMAEGPLTSLEIARQVIALRKLSDDHKTVVTIRKRVGAALWRLKTRGWANEVPQEGEYKGWVRA